MNACSTCNGHGADPMSDNVNWLPCPRCGGSGKQVSIAPDPRSAAEIHGVHHALCGLWPTIRHFVDQDAEALDYFGWHREELKQLQGMALLALAMNMDDLYDEVKCLSLVMRESFSLQVQKKLASWRLGSDA